MTTDSGRGSAALPVLAGMALALLIVLLVVNRGLAATQCDLCKRNCSNKAEKECNGTGGVGSCYYQKFKACEYNECTQPGVCPGGGQITGQADCGSNGCKAPGSLITYEEVLASCGLDAANKGGGAICDNSCWGKSCNTSGGTCRDVRITTTTVWSICNTKCGCE